MMLEPIIELVIEFLVKQAVRHGPRTIRDLWQRIKPPRRRRAFVPRVGLVNRERELRAMRAVLANAPDLRVLYLSGPGGVGKTRLLEEAERLLRTTWTNTPLCWGGILDLYHTDLHSVSALQTAIIRGLDPERRYFQRYRTARERFERRRAEGLAGPGLEAERHVLDELFLEDYHVLAQEHRPVIAFDTLESLSYESDLIQSLCQLEDVPAAVRDWLLNQASLLGNTVLLLAGRNRPCARIWNEHTVRNQAGWRSLS